MLNLPLRLRRLRDSLRRSPFSVTVVVGFVGGLAAIAIVLLAQGASAGEDQTVPPPLVVSQSGADGRSCTRAAPCASFDYAYQRAVGGQHVEVLGGRYAAQRIVAPRERTSSEHVVIRPAQGATVVLEGRLTIDGARHLTVRGLRFVEGDAVADLFVEACSSDVRLEGLVGRWFSILEGTNRIVLKGGSWGGYGTAGQHDSGIGTSGADGPTRVCDGATVAPPARNITIDGVRFHDVFWNKRSGEWGPSHPDCFQINGYAENVTIKNSIFERCGNTFFIIHSDTGAITNLVVERNTFRSLGDDSYYGVQFLSDEEPGECEGWVFRGNLYWPDNPRALGPLGGLRITCLPSGSGARTVRVERNLFQRGPSTSECQASRGPPSLSVWEDNTVVSGGSCGPTTRLPFGYAAADARLVLVESQARAIRRVFSAAARGANPSEIVRELRRVRAPSPRRRWSVSAVRAVIADDVYRGGRWGRPGDHPAIVNGRTWRKAQAVL